MIANTAVAESNTIEKAAAKVFVDSVIVPQADQFDRQEYVPREVIDMMATEGYLGAIIPSEFGGVGCSMVTLSELHEEVGRGCSSLRSLLTVHSMCSYAIARWGSSHHKESWLPRLATGETLGAFALSEPMVGSDAASIETAAVKEGDDYLISGTKKWTTFGQIADLLVVFTKVGDRATAFLVETDNPGLTVSPLSGIMGTTASMCAELHFDNCRVPASNMIGGRGFGFMTVALSALDIGRLSVASGSVGIGQACLDASVSYAQSRRQFGTYLKEHQLIRQMVSNMITNVKAGRLLCLDAAQKKEDGDSGAGHALLIAKYFSSTMAMQAALDAVQIHGANGCSRDYPVQRFMRDAKIMEIIEGSTQIQQIFISDGVFSNQTVA